MKYVWQVESAQLDYDDYPFNEQVHGIFSSYALAKEYLENNKIYGSRKRIMRSTLDEPSSFRQIAYQDGHAYEQVIVGEL